MSALRQSIRGAPDSKMEDTRTTLGNKFMGLQIKVGNGELANSVRPSIRGALDSLVEDA